MTWTQSHQLTYHYADGTQKVFGVSPNEREFKIKYPLNKNLVAVTGQLPPWVEEVSAWSCEDLEHFPTLNSNLKTLYISYCKALRSVPALPPGLTKLTVERCPLVETLSPLPQGLEYLKVDWCESFTTLPELPASLRTLDVWNCPKSLVLPKLPYALTLLRLHGEVVLAAGIERLKAELNRDALVNYIWHIGYVHLKLAMITQYGFEEFIVNSPRVPREVHQDDAGTLYRIDHGDASPIFFVEAVSTPEDGSKRIRRLVDPLMRTITFDANGEPSFSESREKTARNALLSTLGI